MDLKKIAIKILISGIVNGVIGKKVLGAGALFYSDHTGYLDPNKIEGYTYNPADNKWYLSPPSPDYGQYAWLNPATPALNEKLNTAREVVIQHNNLEQLGPFGAIIETDANSSCIRPEVNSEFQAASSFTQRIDPLSLDLDGDGIETVGANAGIIFDFDGDGLKTGTGWVKGDDGFLVLDRNGNGQIDNGGELFGVDTVKANGQKATDGFDALKDFDSNGDGVFDAKDAQFANVRVWQDANQDGIAQAGELKTLAEHNIVAINLDSTASNQNSNGNLISAIGSFVRGDGSEGTVNANQSLAANLDLASNPF